MDAAQWPQGIGVVKPIIDQAPRPVNTTEKKPRPQKEQALNCPRCNSTNTKFCYYNNYSLTQPRYFCKTCRRYWTEGGSLRNVPVGGGSRKNKRSSTSSSSSSSSSLSKKPITDLTTQTFPQNPKIPPGAHDLNLAYNPSSSEQFSTTISHHHHHHLPPMEFLKNNGIPSRGFSSFMQMPLSDCSTIYSSSGLPNLHDFKPPLNFSLDGFENGYNNLQGVQETNAKLFFPLEDLKPVPTAAATAADQFEQNRAHGDQPSNGYWSGMLGGGSW